MSSLFKQLKIKICFIQGVRATFLAVHTTNIQRHLHKKGAALTLNCIMFSDVLLTKAKCDIAKFRMSSLEHKNITNFSFC